MRESGQQCLDVEFAPQCITVVGELINVSYILRVIDKERNIHLSTGCVRTGKP